MSKQYIYSADDQTVIIPDGPIIWNNQSQDQSLQFFDANNTLSTDSTINESYATAIGSAETTQYLSILDDSSAAELTLEDINNITLDAEHITLSNNNSLVELEDKNAPDDKDDENAEVVVFRLEGSDDLYGIQTTKDGSGQIQRYQFIFRQTEDGQLEPIPETVVLLANEDEGTLLEAEVTEVTSSEVVATQGTETNSQDYYLVSLGLEHQNDDGVEESNKETSAVQKVLVKGETLSPTLPEENITDANTVELHTSSQSENIFTKHESVETTKRVEEEVLFDLTSSVDIKQENYLETIQESENEISESEDEMSKTLYISSSDEEVPAALNEASKSSSFVASVSENSEIQEHLFEDNQVEVETSELVVSKSYQEKVGSEVDLKSSSVEQPPITAEDNILNKGPATQPPNSNSLLKDKSKRPVDNVKYYVVYQEKENVETLTGSSIINNSQPSIPKSPKPKFKNVLRASFVKDAEQRDKFPSLTGDNLLPEDDFYLKRFAKNKDALLARRFHNFLNRTTIPQAPVRKERQPRKQQIKPIVERSKEEIIVQEVIISSTGFMERRHKRPKNGKLQVTAVVELSDSEEDSSTNKRLIRTSKFTKFPPDKVIEIPSDNEDSVKSLAESHEVTDRKRKKQSGVPTSPKRQQKKLPRRLPQFVPDHNHSNSDSSTSVKSDLSKKEVICPFCPKTFPSQNSLNTHIIHHNLENSLQNKAKMNSTRQSLLPKVEYNHKCNECEQSFKNVILLRRHNCPHLNDVKSARTCTVCLKQFSDITLFNMHKRIHVKSNLIKNTSSALNISPKIASPRKAPKKAGFKCSDCSKVCDTEAILKAHVKVHKKFVCSFCSTTFTSKILLDSHVRTNCVKNRRMSFTITKNFVQTPPRRLSMKRRSPKSALGVKIPCDQCAMKFSTFRNLYTHKVQIHGMSTPDKSLVEKKKPRVHREKLAHSGVPANARLQQGFAAIRQKMLEAQLIVK